MPNEPQQSSPEQGRQPSTSGHAVLLRWGVLLLAVVLLAGFAVSRLAQSWQERPHDPGDRNPAPDPVLNDKIQTLRTRIDGLKSAARHSTQAYEALSTRSASAPRLALPEFAAEAKRLAERKPPLTKTDAETLHKKLDDIELTLTDPDARLRLEAVARESADYEYAINDFNRVFDRDLRALEQKLAGSGSSP